ncbi:MAG: flagellar basal body P-ring formation protein FlgA [Bacteroidetes bacterium]|nr:flagellar basal body P-ring formation protein FlgA [Bacteroidota bacterium]
MNLFLYILSFIFAFGRTETISESAFQNTVQHYLVNELQNSGVEYHIEYRSLPKEIILPQGDYTLRITSQRPPALKGYVSLPVEIWNGSACLQTVMCSVLIRTFETVYVTNRMFEKNEEIDLTSLTRRNLETTFFREAPITSVEPLKQKRMKKNVKENSVIVPSVVEELPVIQRDDVVTIMVKSNNVLLRSTGIARQEGFLGRKIPVVRSGSKEIVQAKVIGKQTVEIIAR